MSKNNNLEKIRHSLSHILATVINNKYKHVKFGIGPVIENGFYYDFDFSEATQNDSDFNITEADLPRLEKEMKKLIKQNIEFIQKKCTREEAKVAKGYYLYNDEENPYKKELINELLEENKKISFYESGSFTDLCAGPHVKSTKEINPEAFKLTKVAGAYWRGDEKNKMLTRIYGVAFATKKELDDYLEMMEEAEKRDHRKLGQELKLFILDEDVGQGLPLWMPKGAILRQEIENFVLSEYQKRGYQLVLTPHIGSEKLFNISGHLDFYKEGMYSPMDIDGEKYYIKPMNCPMHVKIYQNELKSYRELPIRYTELGTVYRYERSGTLHGLTRVRGFTQDDAHIICTPKQLPNELLEVLKLTDYILKTFGFKNFKVALSVRDPKDKKKYLGNDKDWDFAEKSLIQALKQINWDYIVEEGEAVFYGPKVDIKITDAINREWQISTLQVDFNLPEKFKMTYIDDKGNKKQPFMLHRALLGSLERFTGVLIEHYAGAFPLWLSPTQVKIISVGSAHQKFCEDLAKKFKDENIRVETDLTNETVGNKIRKAVNEKVPYMLVIGDKEMESDKLTVRARGQKKLLELPYNKFIEKIKKLISDKNLEL